MRNYIFAVVALVAFSALAQSQCVSPSDTRNALQAMGFTNIEVGGRAWFGCSEDDTFATRFTATNPQGHVVTGQVCSGPFKGSTVRFD